MLRITAGILSVLAGLAAAFAMIYFWVGFGGSLDTADALGWTFIVSMFTLPLVAIVLAVGIPALEALVILTNWPRLLVILSGTLLIPLGVAIFVGAPYLAIGAMNPRLMEHGVQSAWFGVAALIPSFAACLTYALLTWPLSWTPKAPPAATPSPQPTPPPALLLPLKGEPYSNQYGPESQ